MTDMALSALTAAWAATVITTTLLAAAVALSQICDSAFYLCALPRALSLDLWNAGRRRAPICRATYHRNMVASWISIG
ncbi:MAG: hypothetical protein WA709_28775 [Stellaceae bacterium]